MQVLQYNNVLLIQRLFLVKKITRLKIPSFHNITFLFFFGFWKYCYCFLFLCFFHRCFTVSRQYCLSAMWIYSNMNIFDSILTIWTLLQYYLLLYTVFLRTKASWILTTASPLQLKIMFLFIHPLCSCPAIHLHKLVKQETNYLSLFEVLSICK